MLIPFLILSLFADVPKVVPLPTRKTIGPMKLLSFILFLLFRCHCFGAPSISYTSYFNNTHTYTNATIAGTNFASRGVFTNSLSAAGFATSGTTNATLTGNLLANGAVLTNSLTVLSADNLSVPFLRSESSAITAKKALVVTYENASGNTNGIQLGDFGSLGDTSDSFAVPMGLFRAGWSTILNRNLSYNGTYWVPVANTNAYWAASELVELGAEGFSVHTFPPATTGQILGHMQFSVRPRDRRFPSNVLSAGGRWNQFHSPIFARWMLTTNDNCYQGNSTYPMLYFTSDGSGIGETMWLETASAFRSGSSIHFKKARGTPESKTAISQYDFPMILYANAWDGSAYQITAGIQSIVTGTVSAGNAAQALRFVTSPSNSAGLRDRMEIGSGGNVGIGVTNATSTLQVAGSFAHSIATGTAFTLTDTNEVYLCNVDAQTVTLPTAVGVIGRTYTIKTIAPAETATVATTSSQLIDGSTTYSLTASNKFVRVISDNARWWVIGNN